MTDYAAVLTAIRPGTSWELVGNTYSGLTWLDDSPKPTKKTLDDAWPAVQHDLEVAATRAERQRRYLAQTDPLFMKAQRDEEDGVTLADWKAAVAAIKADLPYPEEPA
jgi:hypothetical protein